MGKIKFTLILTALFICSFSLLSCGGSESSNNTNIEEEIDQSGNDTIYVVLNSNDKMQFDKDEIMVYEGQIVNLTLNHTGTMPVSSMGHNFVLLTEGTSVSNFSRKALKAKDHEYIPQNSEEVIAHTALIGGGESDVIIFQAPVKGTYDFLCSFPGHYSIMKGKFKVK